MKSTLTAALATLAGTLLMPTYNYAARTPHLGTVRAQAHQTCGKDIVVQIATTPDKQVLIGLRNKTTQETDLFVATTPFDISIAYASFIPVKYDALSRHFIPTREDDIDVVWGGAADEYQQVRHSLALGDRTYPCGAIIPWPADRADTLYGEPADTPAAVTDTSSAQAVSGNASATPGQAAVPGRKAETTGEKAGVPKLNGKNDLQKTTDVGKNQS